MVSGHVGSIACPRTPVPDQVDLCHHAWPISICIYLYLYTYIYSYMIIKYDNRIRSWYMWSHSACAKHECLLMQSRATWHFGEGGRSSPSPNTEPAHKSSQALELRNPDNITGPLHYKLWEPMQLGAVPGTFGYMLYVPQYIGIVSLIVYIGLHMRILLLIVP